MAKMSLQPDGAGAVTMTVAAMAAVATGIYGNGNLKESLLSERARRSDTRISSHAIRSRYKHLVAFIKRSSHLKQQLASGSSAAVGGALAP